MPRALSNEMKEALFASNTGEVFATLLTITSDDLAEPIRVSSDPTVTLSSGVPGTISNGIEYPFVPFELIAPGENPDSLPVPRLTMDNISREITSAVRQIRAVPEVLIQIVRASAPDDVEAEIKGFKMRDIDADALTISADLYPARLDLEPFPSNKMTPATFPGLF